MASRDKCDIARVIARAAVVIFFVMLGNLLMESFFGLRSIGLIGECLGMNYLSHCRCGRGAPRSTDRSSGQIEEDLRFVDRRAAALTYCIGRYFVRL